MLKGKLAKCNQLKVKLLIEDATKKDLMWIKITSVVSIFPYH
ncbi:hypothetical protein DB42_AK00730 [Neochlamydia sp. EPS4]|nr:hypothetical protein DB42_AK00730 [Neochlamydia sp. EPS4]